MSLSLKIKKAIDNTIGGPVLTVLAVLSRIASYLGAKNRRKSVFKDGDTIIVMKFQGLGSLVLAKPGLDHLHKQHPKSKIYFWGTPGTTCLAELMPEFEGVIKFNDSNIYSSLKSCVYNLFKVWQLKPKWTYDLEVYSRLSSCLAMLTFAPNRAGFAIDVVGKRKYTHTHLLLYNRYKWIGLAYGRLFSLIDGLEPYQKDDYYGLWRFDYDEVSNLKSKTYIVINPHTGDLAQERKWPTENFVSLITKIRKWKPGVTIVVMGKSADEVERSNFISRNFKDGVISLAGSLSLKETMCLLKHALIVISNDSGPMHLAIAVGAPTVCLFGPTRPRSYIIESQKVRAVYKDLYCSPCIHHWDLPPCGGDNICMKNISIDDVMDVIKLVNNRSLEEFKRIEELPVNNASDDYYEGLVLKR